MREGADGEDNNGEEEDSDEEAERDEPILRDMQGEMSAYGDVEVRPARGYRCLG